MFCPWPVCGPVGPAVAPGGPVPTGQWTGANRAPCSRFSASPGHGPAPGPVWTGWSGPIPGRAGLWAGRPGTDQLAAPVTRPVDRSVDRTARSVARSDRVLNRTARSQARLTGLLDG